MRAKVVVLVVIGLYYAVGLSLGDTPVNCTYEDSKGTWTLLIGKEQLHYSTQLKLKENFPIKQKYTVTLYYPDKAIDQYGNMGFWTLIYNQGFELVINNRKFFSFYKYKQNGKIITSICNETFAGYTHDVLQRNWALFRAVKMGPYLHRTHTKREVHEKQYYKNNPQFIDQINKIQNMWTAKKYLYYERLTIQELSRRLGQPVGEMKFPRTKEANPNTKRLAAQLPQSFDWRNVNGVNYVSPVRNQATCGSCYAFASAALLESRLLIESNKTVEIVLSPQDIVECSQYSQGCNGGFPYLVAGKYAEDFGMIEEKCNPYKGKDGKCSTSDKCQRHYATNYKYVGGYYGACNELEMKLELIHSGPIAVSFMVYDDFKHYAGGIYRHTGLKDGFNPFEITNHVVLVVGYGVDTKSQTKFWIVKNSWGKDWGENGYFRIIRGNDECGIESMAVLVDPMF